MQSTGFVLLLEIRAAGSLHIPWQRGSLFSAQCFQANQSPVSQQDAATGWRTMTLRL